MNPNSEYSELIAQAQHHLDQAYFHYEETENFAQVLQECDAAIEIDPYLSEAHNLRGMALEEFGRNLEAVDAYREAIRLNPDFSEARDNLSELKSEMARNSRVVTIATFSHAIEAYIPKTKLDVEGIWSFVADEETVTMYWLYSNAIGGAKLQVKEADVERAIKVLGFESNGSEQTKDDLGESDEVPSCPVCNSTNTYYETYAMRLIFGFWFFSLFLLVFVGIGTFGLGLASFTLPFLKRKWKCNDCGYSFRVERSE